MKLTARTRGRISRIRSWLAISHGSEFAALSAFGHTSPTLVEQRPRVEALDRDHAHARQRDGERADVVLEVVELDALEVGQRAAHHLPEPEQADAPLRLLR